QAPTAGSRPDRHASGSRWQLSEPPGPEARISNVANRRRPKGIPLYRAVMAGTSRQKSGKERADAQALVRAHDRFSKKRRDTHDTHASATVRGKRDGVGHDHFLDRGVVDPVQRVRSKHTVGRADEYPLRP